jgi:hypothetical protein
MAPFVESTGADAIYEVVGVVRPADRAAAR